MELVNKLYEDSLLLMFLVYFFLWWSLGRLKFLFC